MADQISGWLRLLRRNVLLLKDDGIALQEPAMLRQCPRSLGTAIVRRLLQLLLATAIGHELREGCPLLFLALLIDAVGCLGQQEGIRLDAARVLSMLLLLLRWGDLLLRHFSRPLLLGAKQITLRVPLLEGAEILSFVARGGRAPLIAAYELLLGDLLEADVIAAVGATCPGWVQINVSHVALHYFCLAIYLNFKI